MLFWNNLQFLYGFDSFPFMFPFTWLFIAKLFLKLFAYTFFLFIVYDLHNNCFAAISYNIEHISSLICFIS